MKKSYILATVILLVAITAFLCLKPHYVNSFHDAGGSVYHGTEIRMEEGNVRIIDGEYDSFLLSGEAFLEDNAIASIRFSANTSDTTSGYEVRFHNGPIDGSIKTGSLTGIRNLYRSLVRDGEWFGFEISVMGNHIRVTVDGTEVVSYTESAVPYRSGEYVGRLLGNGNVILSSMSGSLSFRNIRLENKSGNISENQELDEQSDSVMVYIQKGYPMIDWHVHLKGGLTKELAHEMSMKYGISYGVAPNAGEGGVGRMLASDAEVYEYYNEVCGLPFLCGVQGEGRKWTSVFSKEALGIFDYLFTDAMTIVDHKGRLSRIYRPEEVMYDDIDYEGYMEHLVDQTVLILSNEPADIFANPTFLPDELNADYDKYWTDVRVDLVLDTMVENGIAMEINARYRIPSFSIISKAKEKGIKFVFGTNNVDANFGKLEYCLEAINACGLVPDDFWFPSMSVRNSRETIIYNKW